MGSSVHDDDEDKLDAFGAAIMIWFGALTCCMLTLSFVCVIVALIRMIFNY